jgi:hypothetical protein
MLQITFVTNRSWTCRDDLATRLIDSGFKRPEWDIGFNDDPKSPGHSHHAPPNTICPIAACQLHLDSPAYASSSAVTESKSGVPRQRRHYD